MESKQVLLRALPKVDECIEYIKAKEDVDAPVKVIKNVVTNYIDKERQKILTSSSDVHSLSMEEWGERFREGLQEKLSYNLKKVFNGTGVVIHTNLGRSVLSEKATERLQRAGGNYSNLEFNLNTGKRGSRYSLVEELVCDLTGAEAAMIVNNNAAAVLISLDTLAKGKEVIVSRGQLVEIGGSFRIPDVMAKSGACLKEVGATNRTHLYDYENAITEYTGMLLRVHSSNFKIIGFTSEVSPQELVELAKKKGLVTMEDLGSGCLIDLSEFGYPKEPTVQEIVQAGIDVVTFSGDKLLGGPQAGIIVGAKSVIDKIKKNPLNRALRIDKFTLASLESVLREYYDLEKALKNIPTLEMLTTPVHQLKKRAQKISRMLKNKIQNSCEINVVPAVSRVGGGAIPEYSIASWAVELQPDTMKISTLEKLCRGLETPVIGRIENERFLLDVRTLREHEISDLTATLQGLFTGGE